MTLAASQMSSDSSQSDELTKLIHVFLTESVHVKHRKRAKTALANAEKSVAVITKHHAAAIKRHKKELSELMAASQSRLDANDAKLSELWQDLGEAKTVMQASQLEFQEGVCTLLRRHGQTREKGVQMIKQLLNDEMSAPAVVQFLSMYQPSEDEPSQQATMIKAGRISDVTLVNLPSNDDEDMEVCETSD